VIYWDLDGVLRDISTATFGFHVPTWHHKGDDGKGIIQRVNDNISLLVKAPKTEYADIVERAYEVLDEPLHILTVQPKRWQSYTRLWIMNNLSRIDCEITIFAHANEKYEYFMADGNGILVEDHPCLPSYERIVLVRRPWNSSVNHAHKVINNVDEMHAFILGEVL
jgi:hypothetical protein